MPEYGSSGLQGEASTPVRPSKGPGEFAIRPTLRKVEADTAQQRAACPFLHSKHAETAELPVANEHRHLPPGVVPAENRADTDVTHDLRVRTHGGVGINVVVSKGPQQQPFGFKREH